MLTIRNGRKRCAGLDEVNYRGFLTPSLVSCLTGLIYVSSGVIFPGTPSYFVGRRVGKNLGFGERVVPLRSNLV